MSAIPEDKVHPEFSDVYINEARSFFADGYDPTFDSDLVSLRLRSLVSVSRSQTIVSKTDGTGRFRIFFGFGARWFKAEDGNDAEPEPQATADSSDDDALIIIECEVVAEFLLSKRYEQADLDNFALSEAVNYVIPYWKNYLISQCGIMRLQNLVLPDGDNN